MKIKNFGEIDVPFAKIWLLNKWLIVFGVLGFILLVLVIKYA